MQRIIKVEVNASHATKSLSNHLTPLSYNLVFGSNIEDLLSFGE